MAYLLDEHEAEARRRLELLARIEDPGTKACLARTGLGEGTRCLEVGAGVGSIARWLSEQVGAEGRVVATDLETRFLEPLRSSVLEVRRHDVATDALEENAFDLVHVRHVLVHLPERASVLEKLARAVKPGGWLAVEEIDHTTDAPDPTAPEPQRELYQRVMHEIYGFVREKGLDPTFGGQLFGRFRSLGFTELSGEGRVHQYRGHPREEASPHVAAFVELRGLIVERGSVTAEDFDAFVALTRDPGFSWREGLTMAVVGRKAQTSNGSADGRCAPSG